MITPWESKSTGFLGGALRQALNVCSSSVLRAADQPVLDQYDPQRSLAEGEEGYRVGPLGFARCAPMPRMPAYRYQRRSDSPRNIFERHNHSETENDE